MFLIALIMSLHLSSAFNTISDAERAFISKWTNHQIAHSHPEYEGFQPTDPDDIDAEQHEMRNTWFAEEVDGMENTGFDDIDDEQRKYHNDAEDEKPWTIEIEYELIGCFVEHARSWSMNIWMEDLVISAECVVKCYDHDFEYAAVVDARTTYGCYCTNDFIQKKYDASSLCVDGTGGYQIESDVVTEAMDVYRLRERSNDAVEFRVTHDVDEEFEVSRSEDIDEEFEVSRSEDLDGDGFDVTRSDDHEALRYGGDGHHEREHEEEDHELFQDKDHGDGRMALRPLMENIGFDDVEPELKGFKVTRFEDIAVEQREFEDIVDEQQEFEDVADEQREFVVVRGVTVHSNYDLRWRDVVMVLIGCAMTVCGAAVMSRCKAKDTEYTPISDGPTQSSSVMYV